MALRDQAISRGALIACIIVFFITTLCGCGNDMVVKGKERTTIGIVNIIVDDSSIMEPKYPDIQYRVIWGNVVWGLVLSETVIAPIYFFGFSMFEPVGEKKI
jgi:hypothetical protein